MSNLIDDVDKIIFDCLNQNDPKSFFLFAGAGSGKTRSLVNVLEEFKQSYEKKFRLERKKVAIITYTKAASEEIIHRLNYNPIFHVSTIHSFAWDLISHFTLDIKIWLNEKLETEITDLEAKQSKSRNLVNKTSLDRAKKIESKKRRIQNLEKVTKFTYNPDSNDFTRYSLNHFEVISIAAFFINKKKLMQDLVVARFPVILIDESQDTKKELIDAFFELHSQHKKLFSLGMFGDMMQRIYTDGKENLGNHLPADIIRPLKKINYRSNKRIITLINNIRKKGDGQKQIPSEGKKDGYVRFFICKRGQNKDTVEKLITRKMANVTKDRKWCSDDDNYDIKTLILEHHMAARRMGFLDFFLPLYKVSKLKTGLLDGSLATVSFFTSIILPIVEAHKKNDKFEITRVVKKYSSFLKKEELKKSSNQVESIQKTNEAVKSFLELFTDDQDPLLFGILKNIHVSGLFLIPSTFISILNNAILAKDELDAHINAWKDALMSPFSQIKNYHDYLSEKSKFGTHQGVKGLEYDRVMVVIDDEESSGFLFSYDKLFGAKEISETDEKNIQEGKETSIDRTNRLFYVACSRAKESLAIVAYTDNTNIIERTVLEYNWFTKEEIEVIDN